MAEHSSSQDAFAPFELHSITPSKQTAATSAQGDDFDPFRIGMPALGDDVSAASSSNTSVNLPPELNRLTRAVDDDSSTTSSKRHLAALPPRVILKLTLHEEVTSTALRGVENEGASHVAVEGTIHAQMHSSDALKNSPFALVASTPNVNNLNFRGNDTFVDPRKETVVSGLASFHVVHIPKTELASVPIGKYTIVEEIRHMPILLERKVTMDGTRCRVAIQVRSKMSNEDDMVDFTIAIAVPESLKPGTVRVTRGLGAWNELKRTIKWTLTKLIRGESFMVSAQAELRAPDAGTPHFPVLLRCTSAKDQISTIEFGAAEVEGHPATIVLNRTASFRLLHRIK